MDIEQLKNPPLAEVILEVRWKVRPPARPAQTEASKEIELKELTEAVVDPSYDLLIGRLYDRISNNFPFHERLPTATFPRSLSE